MRVALLLFLFLCSFLFTGGHYTHATTQLRMVRAIKAHYTRHAGHYGITNREGKSITTAGAGEQQNQLVSIEDDDENSSQIRRYTLTAQCMLIMAFTFILSGFFSWVKTPLPVCSYLSYHSTWKYLLQRSIRI